VKIEIEKFWVFVLESLQQKDLKHITNDSIKKTLKEAFKDFIDKRTSFINPKDDQKSLTSDILSLLKKFDVFKKSRRSQSSSSLSSRSRSRSRTNSRSRSSSNSKSEYLYKNTLKDK
jgi:hypothetical protein